MLHWLALVLGLAWRDLAAFHPNHPAKRPTSIAIVAVDIAIAIAITIAVAIAVEWLRPNNGCTSYQLTNGYTN